MMLIKHLLSNRCLEGSGYRVMPSLSILPVTHILEVKLESQPFRIKLHQIIKNFDIEVYTLAERRWAN